MRPPRFHAVLVLATDRPPAFAGLTGYVRRLVELHVTINEEVIVTTAMAVVVAGAELHAAKVRVIRANADLCCAAGTAIVANVDAG